MVEIAKVHEILTLGEHLPRTKIAFFREILFPTAKLIFSSSYTYSMWLKIKIYFGIFKNWIRKHDGLWNTHHLEGGNVSFHWGLKLQLLLVLKTLHCIIPFEMALDYIIYDTFNDILT